MKIFRFAFIAAAMLTTSVSSAQYNRGNATVVAQNYDISDNLDLQAVASIFGESRDLEDFERRLNDPGAQISNLDLNNDNYVDYLRVIEVGESDVRVIVVQAVLGQDMFQDVATIELERQRNRSVQVQIVGNSYIYGPNYIYEPFYYSTPVFFDMFWLATYRPYYSPWYWGYYPTYYSYWRPMPVFSYHSHIYSHINHRNRYSYTDNRRLVRADRMYSNVRGNSLERQNPNRSFTSRNSNVTNRRALETSRGTSRSTANNANISRRNEGNRMQTNEGRNTSVNRSTTVNSGRQRVSSEEFSRNRSNANNRSINSSRATIQNSNARSNSSSVRSNSSTIRREAAPASSRIERSSRISSQPSKSFNQSSSNRSSSSISRGSSSNVSRSSAPSMSRSSGSMGGSRGSSGGGGRSSGGGMTRGGR